MLAAEKKVRPTNRKYHWSKALDQAGYRIRYWKTRLSDFRNHSAPSPSLDSVRERAGIDPQDHEPILSLGTLLQNLTTAQHELKTIQPQDKKHRQQSLQDRLDEATLEAKDSDDPEAAQKAAKAIEAIICSEHCQETYDRIKRATKGISGNNGLDRLDVPHQNPPKSDPSDSPP
jgi:hypothetical protein